MPILSGPMGEVLARKRELTLGSYRDAYAASGVAIGTWERLERGESVQRRSLLRAVVSLGWPPTAATALLEGRDPDTPPDEPQVLLPRYYEELERAKAEGKTIHTGALPRKRTVSQRLTALETEFAEIRAAVQALVDRESQG